MQRRTKNVPRHILSRLAAVACSIYLIQPKCASAEAFALQEHNFVKHKQPFQFTDSFYYIIIRLGLLDPNLTCRNLNCLPVYQTTLLLCQKLLLWFQVHNYHRSILHLLRRRTHPEMPADLHIIVTGTHIVTGHVRTSY